ncbi:MAG: bifunctional diaminohydroxyphosphoribosylaminopyrimidine deaminase/5-amino-6-(5-phosphoribosylamino)uracil reductase RibD [Cohaesibacter sp.]|jgi:diaminohydroxyphosphoribosylaminopyrimidine deaminase/5-amino-6-(5-phosphoribosylamino)uracil reductase|nr:bifunctional diaminohydroxyphosphoribosylaminopyrimidine deaminase/5-amino-6-(5-phosphoribosylamino)uracil reductase RibD [Cohaesibacter sp.]
MTGPQQITPQDERFMALALRLGRRHKGLTGENPSVGCVLVKETPKGCVIVGQGTTARTGRPHAERVALAEAGAKAKGATAYVSLEPCAHTGKSPPCTEGLIKAGVRRVVCAMKDPDPRVSGQGFEQLRKAGIEVSVGLLEDEAKRDLSGFLSRTITKMPWLQAKMAVSPDGFIGRRDEGNVPVTGPEAKKRTYLMRSQADAIMVGVDTILIDDPALTVRLSGLEGSSSIRVVLDSKGRIPLSAHVVQTAFEVPTWIVSSGLISAEKALALEARGCTLLLTDPTAQGRVDLTAALAQLAEQGINRIFCESGAILSRSLLDQGLVDEFILFEGAKPLGEGVSALSPDPHTALLAAGMALESKQHYGKDVISTYRRGIPRF